MYDNSVRLIDFLGQNAQKRTARNKTPYVILNLAYLAALTPSQ